MNLKCNIIQDLLPLYHDGVCSDDSSTAVAEHLNDCEMCREELRLIETDLNAPHISPNSKNAMRAASEAWKKNKKSGFIKGIVIAVIICALLVGGFMGLTQWRIIPASSDVLEVTELSQLSDGRIIFNLFVNDNKNLHFIKFTETDDGCFYLTPMHSVIETTRTYHAGLFSKYHVFYPPGYDAEQLSPGVILSQNIEKIYVGPVGDGILVWEKGMELQKASDVLEKTIFG